MTMPLRIETKCSVCGFESNYTVVGSTNTMGAPDLDLRPAEMARSTMHWWIHRCPECGYVALGVDKETKLDRSFFESEAYRSCDGIAFSSILASLFYKSYMIKKAEEDWYGAGFAAQRAAWDCDDAFDEENAVLCRKLAVEALEKLFEVEGYDEELTVMKADLLRRAGLFDRVIEEFNPSDFSEEILQKIVAFQIEKAKEKDTGCYTVASVTGKT